MWWRRFGEKVNEEQAMVTVNENLTNVQSTNDNTEKSIIYGLVAIVIIFYIVNKINKYVKEYVRKKNNS